VSARRLARFSSPGRRGSSFASTHLDPKAAEKQKAELDFRASGKQRRYSWDYDETMDIFSCNQDGTQMMQLTKERGYDAEGSFSPDGKQIVFCSLRSAYDHELTAEEKQRLDKDPAWFGEIYIMNADGSECAPTDRTCLATTEARSFLRTASGSFGGGSTRAG
jgi:Tol biopolymer transport system component